MKLKQYIAAASLLALMGLPAGCSKEEAMDNGKGTEVPSAGIRQLVFNFGGLRLPDGASTRAESIATQDETQVESLIILLAGVDDETHTTGKAAVVYEYRASWATEPTETSSYKKLVLQQNGNLLTGTLNVDEAVMLPEYISKKALVLVNGVKVRLTDASGTARDIATGSAFADIAATTPEDIYRMCGGQASGEGFANGTRMELAWGPADLTKADIKCPLPMSATINRIDFHGSTNLNVQLKRHVSRFDLRNGQTAQLRVGSIRPLSATTGIEFDDATRQTRVDMQDQSFVPAQNPGADWENVPAEVAPAFYTFPSALHQGKQMMKLRVTAKKLNGNGTWENKTYTLNLANADKQPISIDANTRYVINISEVTDLNITASITIADWQQGGDVDGDLNPNPASRKAPTLQQMADDPDGKFSWDIDPVSSLPTALNFGKAYANLATTFITPGEQVPSDADPGEPKVSIDIFREDGVADGVWLEATESPAPTTRSTPSDVLHTLTILSIPDNPYPPLYVKVKNYHFPEQFVMFRVTGQDMGDIKIDTDTDNPVNVPDGWETDDNDVFEEGTVIAPPAPIYGTNAVYSVNGYWVTAPGEESATYAWGASSSASSMTDPCAAHGKGWVTPTMKDFEVMLGWSTTLPWDRNNYSKLLGKFTVTNTDSWSAAFQDGFFYYSSDDAVGYSLDSAYGVQTKSGTVAYDAKVMTDLHRIRCIQKQ